MDSSHKRSWQDMDFGASFGTAQLDDPLTRIRIDETASAATRQKSCNACVRGKRRCDKRTPRCSRCAAKNLDCIYQKMPPSAAADAVPVAMSAASASASSSTMSEVPDFDSLGFDIDSMGADTSPESLHADSYCPPMSAGGQHTASTATSAGLDFNIADLMGSADHEDIWNLHPFADAVAAPSKLDIPAVPAAPSLGLNTDGSFNSMIDEVISSSSSSSSSNVKQLVPLRDASLVNARLESKCAEFDPMQAHDPTTSLGFTVGWLTGVHSMFAKTRSLPFMHPRLWTSNGQQLPKPVLTAFSASAAYASSTPSSKGWTVRLLADAGREIHREGERASSPAEKLARVQGLIILDTMRIFDGDLALRASTERETPVLLGWLKELTELRDSMEGDEGMKIGRDKPPKSWEVSYPGHIC